MTNLVQTPLHVSRPTVRQWTRTEREMHSVSITYRQRFMTIQEKGVLLESVALYLFIIKIIKIICIIVFIHFFVTFYSLYHTVESQYQIFLSQLLWPK